MEAGFHSATSGGARVVLNGADVYIMADGNLTLAAGGTISIQRAGGTAELGGGGPVSVVAGGVLALKGPFVKIN